MSSKSYRSTELWKRAMQLSVATYELARQFPRDELYGLSSQLRRASVSIVSNIAEGHGRNSLRQLLHFMSIARGSTFEVEAQLLLAAELKMGDPQVIHHCEGLCDEVSRMLFAAMRTLKAQLEAAELNK